MFEEPRHRSNSILSNRTNTTWRADVFGKPRLNRGAMVFTGPDGLRQHRQSVLDPDYVGEGNWGWTPERTSSAFYVMRAAPETPHPRPKSSYSDAYGFGCWGPSAAMCSWRHKDHAIKLGPFRQQLEQDATHLGQAPWYPAPGESREAGSAPAYGRTRENSARGSANGPTAGGRILNQRQQQRNNSNIATASRTTSLQSLPAATAS